ncbi:uncharacterized protein PG986_012484 [Apiospora aurea]|uniref:Cytochrome b n=1 Tax=Apiospora aurea TaxID=335848 RepID=A0ABR1Q1A3_9PEZI
MNYLFDAGLYLPKLSMVAIYYHLIPMHFHGLRRALHFTGFFVGSSFFITFFSDTFWCGPHPSVQCLTSLSGREKAGLVGIFTLGAVTIGVSSGRFATMMMKGNDISLFLRLHHDRRGHGAAAADSEGVGGHDLHVQALISGSGRRAPRFFKSGSGGTGDSIKELKPGIHIEQHHHQHHHLHQPRQSASWPDQITPIAEGDEQQRGNGGRGTEIPLNPLSQNAIIKTERFSISSGHQLASARSMDLESGGGAGAAYGTAAAGCSPDGNHESGRGARGSGREWRRGHERS